MRKLPATKSVIDRLGGRKFLVAIYIITGVFVLCLLKKLTGAQCITGVTIVAGLYKAANVAATKVAST